MAQDSLPTKGKAAAGKGMPPSGTAPVPDKTEIDEDPGSAPGSSGTARGQAALAQTEAFTINPQEKDDAAGFLLGDGDRVGAANTAFPTAPTEEFTMKAPADDEDDAAGFVFNDKTEGDQAGATTEMFEDQETPAKKPAQALDKTQPMGDSQVEAAKKKDAQLAAADKVAGQPKATVLGDFKLIKKLGQGGMGTVFKAHQISLDREAALKVLARELTSKPAFVERFKREARVMAKLDHPNILRCFHVGEEKGLHYLAMEFVEGGSIEGYRKKLGKFSLGDALHIVLACAAALDHAHEKGLIHRDIKPDNILLTKKGVVKVADLGLAKATDDDMGLTKTGTGAGTPIYMAPEQARDAKHVDSRADIYAMGCMLYVLVTGDAPFKGETLVELIEAKEKGKFSPMRKANPEVPERLDLIVDKMLAKEPKLRYLSCAEIIAEIEALGLHNNRLSFLEGEPSQVKTTANKGDPAGPKMEGPAAKATMVPAGPAAQTAIGMVTGKAAIAGEAYFWQFTNDEGENVTKKLKKDQLVTLIKSGSLDATDQVSKSAKGGYRALGTYVEFTQYFKGALTKEKADKKSDKFRDMYKQIESEEKSRQRWRFIHNLYLKAGGLIGFLLWMCVVAGILVGGFFLVRWLLTYLGETVQKAGGG